jgi:dolichol-phosphate mannosyltransferase
LRVRPIAEVSQSSAVGDTKLRTLIFVPTYNERDNAEKMANALSELPVDADLLFMDDGSPDGTGEILDAVARRNPRLSVVHRQGKLGIGSAHLEGIRWAYNRGYERLVTLDCDFTHSPDDVPRLIEKSVGYCAATGSRYLESDSLPGWNLLRRSLTSFGHLLTKHLLGIAFDATGALRAYDLRRIPRELFEQVQARGYGFFFESMFLLVRNGFSINEFPIVLPARTYGTSKMTPRDAVRSGSQLLALWVTSTVRSSRFRVRSPDPETDPSLTDPQKWDSYWDQKVAASTMAYDAIAATYRKGIIKPELERAIFSTFPDGSHLLHAGCGSGQVDAALHSRLHITAVDISASAIKLYRSNNPAAFGVRHSSILDLPYAEETFDGAYNLGVLEHFTRDEILAILAELNRVVKRGGKLVLFWPHAKATSVAVLGAVHWMLSNVAGSSTQLHPAEVSLLQSKAWVEELLRSAGFALKEYSFGPRDFFVQAVVVAEKTEHRA